jgi:hypothetical protein
MKFVLDLKKRKKEVTHGRNSVRKKPNSDFNTQQRSLRKAKDMFTFFIVP